MLYTEAEAFWRNVVKKLQILAMIDDFCPKALLFSGGEYNKKSGMVSLWQKRTLAEHDALFCDYSNGNLWNESEESV